jgi:hypothetical protein
MKLKELVGLLEKHHKVCHEHGFTPVMLYQRWRKALRSRLRVHYSRC